MKKIPFIKLSIALALLLSVLGCNSISYYSQSVVGHSRLMLARQPVDKVIDTADSLLAEQLTLSKQLKQFAVSELGLPDSKSYQSYVALERDFPVWVVVAANEFSISAKQWCYLVIGCANYRGYFKYSSAVKYAEKLTKKGFETSIGGAPAYSTLGWFADPLLPSMLRYGDVNFAETLFHELAHQELYINGDSSFNEAFATVVGQEGAKRWLAKYRPNELFAYQQKLRATIEFNQLVSETKKSLEKVYQSTASDKDKRKLKQQAFVSLKARYDEIKDQQWKGKGWFDSWFKRPINNARLAGFSTYYNLVPVFEKLLAECGGDLPRFYETVAAVPPSKEIDVPKTCT